VSYITKFPLTVSDDGRIETTESPEDQFDLFTSVRPFTLVRDPEYGIDGRLLLQNPISNKEDLLSVYLITLREKVTQYFQNINITRAVASFNREERAINISVYVEREGTEASFNFSVDIR